MAPLSVLTCQTVPVADSTPLTFMVLLLVMPSLFVVLLAAVSVKLRPGAAGARVSMLMRRVTVLLLKVS